uniref:Elongation factor G, mitochondrial n=1 Tax=Haptolina ericina TaxID=156174 RepID=A0A7S3AL21_9EUKA
MDFMELEREKGITIQSAATHCRWGDHEINIIDTPGHVDFTIEVERALRVLDGAILVLCGVAGVQSQSITVDRQMRRYEVPRLAFINKLDREGADPQVVVEALRAKLHLNATMLQIPIGLSKDHVGVVDLVSQQALYFEGDDGEDVRVAAIPEHLLHETAAKRQELFERLADVDDEIGELFLMEEEPDMDVLMAAIRRQTIARTFCPVFMGSAFKNKGVHALLDAVVAYLPEPKEKLNLALDVGNDETETLLVSDSSAPLVGLAFKLEQGKFGQLTYMRLYQGSIARGDTIVNMATGAKIRVPKLVRMHANEMEDVEEGGAGDIVAMFGVDCASGTTFTDGKSKLSMTSMFVPDPVISLSLVPASKTKDQASFSKALGRFMKEDPTFRVHNDEESGQTIISGMGELHLQIYVERMKREYGVECATGQPKVAFRETLPAHTPFSYTHRKQSGGAGQFGKVEGYVEPIDIETLGKGQFEFVNEMIGNDIPSEFMSAIEKGFLEATEKGPLTGSPMVGMRVVLQAGASHAVDSSEMAFRSAARGAFMQACSSSRPLLLEPIMEVEVAVPAEFQGTTVAQISQRKGLVSEVGGAEYATIKADVPLDNMFGYSSELRSSTQGKGEFSMEYKTHSPVMREKQEELVKKFQEAQKAKASA